MAQTIEKRGRGADWTPRTTPRKNYGGHLSNRCFCGPIHSKTWTGTPTAHLARTVEDTSRTSQCRHFCGSNHSKTWTGAPTAHLARIMEDTSPTKDWLFAPPRAVEKPSSSWGWGRVEAFLNSTDGSRRIASAPLCPMEKPGSSRGREHRLHASPESYMTPLAPLSVGTSVAQTIAKRGRVHRLHTSQES